MARQGLGVLRSPLAAAVAAFFQCLGWLFQLLAVYVAMRAFGIHAPLPAAGLVLVLMNIATIFPLWPGNIGLVQAAIALPLTQYGVAKGVGIAFGFGLQAIEASVGIGVGLVFLAHEGLSFAMLRRMPSAADADAASGEEEEPGAGTEECNVRALASPGSLKGVLTAVEAAGLLASGLRRVDGIEVEELPVADGGDSTADVLAAVLGGEWGTARVSDPLGRPVSARFLLLSSGLAVVEAAEAIGLDRLAPDELDPLNASSRGLGELILAALISTRPAALLVCLGGVATVDGGAGLRA